MIIIRIYKVIFFFHQRVLLVSLLFCNISLVRTLTKFLLLSLARFCAYARLIINKLKKKKTEKLSIFVSSRDDNTPRDFVTVISGISYRF